MLGSTVPLRDFRYLSVEWLHGYDTYSVLYSADEISLFTFEWVGMCFCPVNGFSFTDDNGEIRYFAIGSSSYDGEWFIREHFMSTTSPQTGVAAFLAGGVVVMILSAVGIYLIFKKINKDRI